MAKIVALRVRKNTSPSNLLRKVPTRPLNKDVRTREYLLPGEVDALMKAAASVGRHQLRDRTMIHVAYRHGLRVTELCDLQWHQVDFKAGTIHINRLKNGSPSVHFLKGPETRLLRSVLKAYPGSPFIFTTERGGPLCRSTVSKMVARAGRNAGLPFPVHPHMLRHGTGYRLANNNVPTRTIQGFLGHKSIQHTVRYTELSPNAFKDL